MFSPQPQSVDSVLLHYQRLDLVADLEGLEVLDPPFGADQRVVAAEAKIRTLK
jgi:hypothetical protein